MQVPSFHRLSHKYKSLIIDSLSVDFQFSQFLQAANPRARACESETQQKSSTHSESVTGLEPLFGKTIVVVNTKFGLVWTNPLGRGCNRIRDESSFSISVR